MFVIKTTKLSMWHSLLHSIEVSYLIIELALAQNLSLATGHHEILG